MNKKIIIAGFATVVSIFSVSAFAISKTDLSNSSYMVGYELGQQMYQNNLKMNNTKIITGFTDGLDGKDSAVSEKDAKKSTEALRKMMIEKQQKETAQNAKYSKNFMHKIARIKGIIKVNDDVYYQMIQKGNGEMPTVDDTVNIDYTGTTPVPTYTKNKSLLKQVIKKHLVGKTFDSGTGVDLPLANLIPCWTDALVQIPTGSTVILYCSADSAYGQSAPPSIGANQALSFKITVNSINNATE